MRSAAREVWLGGMIRGYDSGYDSWVWFVGMIRGPWFSVSLRAPRIVIYPHLPESVSTVGNYTIRGALWSWHAVDAVRAAVRVVCALWSGHRGAVGVPLQGAGAGCCLLSEWCVQFGAMLVALRVLLQVLPEGDVWRCCCQSGVCCKPCFGAGMLVSGCRWKVLLEGAVELACWCRCRVLLQGAAVKVVCVRFGVGMLVPLQELQGAVVGFSSEAAGGVV